MRNISLWRVHLKPDADGGVDPVKFCLDNGILGVGWDVPGLVYCHSVTEYFSEAEKKWSDYKGWRSAANAIISRMGLNDLVWTRDTRGMYYLGRVSGGWEYNGSKEHIAADILLFRKCEWCEVGYTVGVVPGKVINSFIPSRAVQKVDDPIACEYSMHLYNAKHNVYQIQAARTDLFSCISSDDCEDLVGSFLQESGYIIIPSSCKKSTVAYEYELISRVTGRRAVAQVKLGPDIDCAGYVSLGCKVFLFTTGKIVGKVNENIEVISTEDLKRFILEKPDSLPPRIKEWLKILGTVCSK